MVNRAKARTISACAAPDSSPRRSNSARSRSASRICSSISVDWVDDADDVQAQLRPGRGPVVSGRSRLLQDVHQQSLTLRRVPAVEVRKRELRHQQPPFGALVGQEVHRPLEQLEDGGDVLPAVGAVGCLGQEASGPRCELLRVRIGRTQLGSVSVGLLEVIGDDLLVLRQPIHGDSLQPGGESLVQLRASLLCQRLVGGVADEQMAEPVRLVPGERRLVRPHQLHPHQARQPVGDVRSHRLGSKLGHRPAVEGLALHGRPLDHGPLFGAQPVQPRGEQRLDRRWDGELARVPERRPTCRPRGRESRRR